MKTNCYKCKKVMEGDCIPCRSAWLKKNRPSFFTTSGSYIDNVKAKGYEWDEKTKRWIFAKQEELSVKIHA